MIFYLGNDITKIIPIPPMTVVKLSQVIHSQNEWQQEIILSQSMEKPLRNKNL